MWNPVKTSQAVSEKKTFKKYTILYMYIARGKGQITPKILMEPKQFYFYIIPCKFQPLVVNNYCAFFSTLSPYKCIRAQIWPCRKRVKSQRSTRDHHLNELGRPWLIDALYKDLAQKLFLFKTRSLSILPYIYMAAMLFIVAEPFEQIVNPISTEGPMWNLVKITHTA